MYEQAYQICQNMDVMGLFSEELRILDRNTVQYMIDEMLDIIDEQKNTIDELKATSDEKDQIIAEMQRLITESEKK